jgi:hypothetical protein
MSVVRATVRESATEPAEGVQPEQISGDTPVPPITPAGTANRAPVHTNRFGRHGPVLGASARKNVGMPTVTLGEHPSARLPGRC